MLLCRRYMPKDDWNFFFARINRNVRNNYITNMKECIFTFFSLHCLYKCSYMIQTHATINVWIYLLFIQKYNTLGRRAQTAYNSRLVRRRNALMVRPSKATD